MAKRAYEPARIRTFALVGHRSSGKTSLGDMLLQSAGVTRSVGRVTERTSLLDHEPEERSRGMTLGPSFAWMEWDGHLLNLIDTPGSEGLSHERALAIAGADAAYVVVSAPDGVEFGTEVALRDAARQGVPRVVVLNKMDRASNTDAIRLHLERSTGLRVVPLQLPWFESTPDGRERFGGVISLLQRKLIRYERGATGEYTVEAMPPELRSLAEAAWEHVMESVALTDDDLLEHYLEFLELPVELVQQGMARAMSQGLLIPLLYASSQEHVGAHALLDLAPWALPAPGERPIVATTPTGNRELGLEGPFTARLIATRFDMDDAPYHVLRIVSGLPPRTGEWTNGRTGEVSRVRRLYQVRGPRRTIAVNMRPGCIVATWEPLRARPGDVLTDGVRLELPGPPNAPRMLSWLLTPRTPKDERGLQAAVARLCQMDSALDHSIDDLTDLPVLTGTTPTHLEHAVRSLHHRLGVAVTTSLPPVGYREAPARTVRSIQGVHRRMSGDEVQEYGECWIDLAPCDPDRGVQLVEHFADDDTIPKHFRASLAEGFADGLRSGPTAGYPVLGAEVVCTGGEYDVFMSTEDHFRLAGARAVRAALTATGTRLLEPWSNIEILVPAEEVGHVLNDIAAHRGRILGMEVRGASATVRAHCPDRELRTFAPRLQSITGGRGAFTHQHSHYGWLPAQFVREAIDASPFRNQAKRPEPGTPKPAPREVGPGRRQEHSAVLGGKA